MVDPRVISEWLKKADEDLEFAISVVEESTFYAQICFHFHQASEKFLKSFIIAQDPNLQELMDDCKFLNRFYIDTRYPVHWPTQYTKEEALKARKAAEHIRDVIKSALEPFSSSVS